MAKVPVTFTFGLEDKATGGIGFINSALANLNNAAEYSNKVFKRIDDRFASVTKASKQIGGVFKNVGATLSASLTLPITAMGVSAIKTAADFQQSMNDLQARTGASTEELSLMGAEARRLGTSTIFGASKAVEAMTALGKAGFETKDILSGTAAALNLAAAEGISTEAAAELLSDTLNQFGLTADNAGSVADKLAKAAGLSSISITDLQNSLKYAAPFAAQFGVSIDQVSAAIAVLGNQGIKSEMAGTSLRSFFNTLTGDADRQEKLMKKGVKASQIFTDSTMKTLQPLNKILEALQGAKLSATDTADIFGKEYGGVITKLIGLNGKMVETTEKVGQSVGFVAEVGAARTRGFWGEWEKLKNRIDETYISLNEGEGGPLSVLTALLVKVTSLVDWFNKLGPSTKTWIITLVAIAAVIGPLMVALGFFMTTILPGLIAAFSALTVATGVLTGVAAALGLTMAPVIGVLALLAAGAALLYANWDTLGPIFETTGEVISEIISGLWDEMKAFLDLIIKTVNFFTKFAGLKAIPTFEEPEARAKLTNVFDKQINSLNFAPSAPGATAFEPTQALANQTVNSKNQLEVNFTGFMPPGTTVTPGPKNEGDVKLNTGRAMN